MAEFRRVLKPGAKLAMLVAKEQRPELLEQAGKLGLIPEVDAAIDRKGTAMAALAWAR